MAKHHQDAFKMVDEYKSKFSNETVKNFALNVQKVQNEEIQEMKKMESAIK